MSKIFFRKVFLSLLLLFILTSLISCNTDATDAEGSQTQTETLQVQNNEADQENHAHSFGKWETVKAATCVSEGTKQRVCSCGEIEERSISKKDHTPGAWIITKDPTVTTPGIMVDRCKICSEVLKSESIPPLEDHTTTNLEYCFTYENNTSTCTIVGIGTHSGSDVVIPSRIDGIPVTYISENAFKNCKKITSITIPSSVHTIMYNAFYNCSNLKKVTFSEGLKSIQQNAFAGCSALQSISLPNSLTALGKNAFSNCSSLKTAVIGDNIKTIPSGAFSSCTSLTSITLPKNLTSIETTAFYACSSLSAISFPDTLEYIDPLAFWDCSKLTENVDGVHYIGNWVVSADANVTSVTVRQGTVGIMQFAFANLTSLKEVTLPDGVKIIGMDAFARSTVEKIYIPTTVKKIERGAFDQCNSLKSIIYYGGSETQWNQLLLSSSYEGNISAPIYFSKETN